MYFNRSVVIELRWFFTNVYEFTSICECFYYYVVKLMIMKQIGFFVPAKLMRFWRKLD